MDYVSQCTLEGFPRPWGGEIDSLLKLLKLFEQNPQSTPHIGDPGMTYSGHSASLGTEMFGRLGVAPPQI